MELAISTEFITLSKLLKRISQIDSGGQAKWFLEEYDVYVNGELERRRGRKIYPGDVVRVNELTVHCVQGERQG